MVDVGQEGVPFDLAFPAPCRLPRIPGLRLGGARSWAQVGAWGSQCTLGGLSLGGYDRSPIQGAHNPMPSPVQDMGIDYWRVPSS
jgi:hypothetical protein